MFHEDMIELKHAECFLGVVLRQIQIQLMENLPIDIAADSKDVFGTVRQKNRTSSKPSCKLPDAWRRLVCSKSSPTGRTGGEN